MMGERDFEAEVKERDEIIMSLRLNEHLLKDKLEVSRRNMSKQLERITALENENEELRKENIFLAKQRSYWEQSSKHRKRLLEDCEKELRLHNAYLADKGQAENYTRWKRSNLKWEWTQSTSQEK